MYMAKTQKNCQITDDPKFTPQCPAAGPSSEKPKSIDTTGAEGIPHHTPPVAKTIKPNQSNQDSSSSSGASCSSGIVQIKMAPSSPTVTIISWSGEIRHLVIAPECPTPWA